jgi:hypothetical protein
VSGQIEKVGGSLLAAAFYSFDLLLPIIQRKAFGRTYRLTLQFEDRSGSAWREHTGYSSRYDDHEVGDRVAILYNPNQPSEFALDSWYELWAWPAGFAAAGILGCSLFLSRRGAGGRRTEAGA